MNSADGADLVDEEVTSQQKRKGNLLVLAKR